MTKDQSPTDQVINAIKQHIIADAVIKVLYYVPEDATDLVDLKAVQQACETAHHVVGIIPIRAATKRVRRSGAIHVSMDIPSLLGNYFSEKSELQSKKEILLEKALALLEEKEDQ